MHLCRRFVIDTCPQMLRINYKKKYIYFVLHLSENVLYWVDDIVYIFSQVKSFFYEIDLWLYIKTQRIQNKALREELKLR